MPVLIIVLVLVLVLGIIFVGAYFSIALAFKLAQHLTGGIFFSSLPYSIKRPLHEARGYAKKIKNTVQYCPPGPMRDRLNQTTKPVDEWLINLGRLEQVLSKLYSQHNPNKELRRIEHEIEQVRRQLLVTPNRDEIESLRDLMDSKKGHRAVIKELVAFQNQAELKIRRISADLGRAYSEVLLVSAKGDFNDSRFQRLDENLQDNLMGLRDILATMDEMGYSSATGY